MINTLIVPGLDASPEPHWQHWLAATDPNSLMVDLSDAHRPQPALWEVELASAILQHPGAVLVGHSLGAVLIMKLLEQWPHLNIAGVMLVAPAETSGNDRISHFGPIPEVKIDHPATLVASRNDPWMEFSRAKSLAQSLGADLVDLGQAGHVNVASGYGPWPQVRGMRDALLARSAKATIATSAASVLLRSRL